MEDYYSIKQEQMFVKTLKIKLDPHRRGLAFIYSVSLAVNAFYYRSYRFYLK